MTSKTNTTVSSLVSNEQISEIVDYIAGSLPPVRPLQNFVAVNPLIGIENENFTDAIQVARNKFGIKAELTEREYLNYFESGRISVESLKFAISEFVKSKNYELEIEPLFKQIIEHMESDSFQRNNVTLYEHLDFQIGSEIGRKINEISSWLLGSYLGQHLAWQMPLKDKGVFLAWKNLMPNDPKINSEIRKILKEIFKDLPEGNVNITIQLLERLRVDKSLMKSYLERHIFALPGYTSQLILKKGSKSPDIFGYLAIRLAFELAYSLYYSMDLTSFNDLEDQVASKSKVSDSILSPTDRLEIWRESFEYEYRNNLLNNLSKPKQLSDVETQSIFCIDPRSEGIRRNLEEVGRHATIGFAGFFGLPIAIKDLNSEEAVSSCPVILSPTANVIEVTSRVENRSKLKRRRELNHFIHEVFSATKRSSATPFAFAEAWGWVSGPTMSLKTLSYAKFSKFMDKIKNSYFQDMETSLDFDEDNGWTIDIQVEIATKILKMTGILENPTRLVLLCGHGSKNLNNLHRASLDCGACGGRSGANNARMAAKILNSKEVRENLNPNFRIPDEMHFIAGEHETTSDTIQIFDSDLVPETHLDLLRKLEADLQIACSNLRSERASTLPKSISSPLLPKCNHLIDRGKDWAQIIPEWGLVNNAALIVASRDLTRNLDLGRRTFLHEYNSLNDENEEILKTILGGPMLVAHWISSQYRLSSIDRQHLSAGTKTAHNLVGGLGVIEGSSGDIRLGLPIESFTNKGKIVHEPMRLLVVVDCESHRVENAIESNEDVKRICNNMWVRIVSRDKNGNWVIRTSSQKWVKEEFIN